MGPGFGPAQMFVPEAELVSLVMANPAATLSELQEELLRRTGVQAYKAPM